VEETATIDALVASTRDIALGSSGSDSCSRRSLELITAPALLTKLDTGNGKAFSVTECDT
jgi:hypothetical protein